MDNEDLYWDDVYYYEQYPDFDEEGNLLGDDEIHKAERLDNFYEELKEIHKKSFPDMRFGQFMLNVLGWISSTKKRDPFFQEEDEMLDLIKQYANSNSELYYGWDILNKK